MLMGLLSRHTVGGGHVRFSGSGRRGARELN